MEPLSAKVNIVTRTKDRGILLRRALDSVIGQTFDDWALVIVNDGGDRAHVDPLVEEHGSRLGKRVRVVHHERSLGMEVASNVGLRHAAGEYVVIHDDDDSWEPTFLSETTAFLARPPVRTMRGVITHCVKVDEEIDGDQVIPLATAPFNDWIRQVSLFRMASRNFFPPISFLYERRVLDEIGGYREDLPVLGDWDFNLRFLVRHDIGVLPRALARYHHRPPTDQSVFGNTILAGVDRHYLHETALRNELLRGDLAAGRLGLGVLTNLARAVDDVLDRFGHLPRTETLFSYMKDRIWNAGKRVGLISDA